MFGPPEPRCAEMNVFAFAGRFVPSWIAVLTLLIFMIIMLAGFGYGLVYRQRARRVRRSAADSPQGAQTRSDPHPR